METERGAACKEGVREASKGSQEGCREKRYHETEPEGSKKKLVIKVKKCWWTSEKKGKSYSYHGNT